MSASTESSNWPAARGDGSLTANAMAASEALPVSIAQHAVAASAVSVVVVVDGELDRLDCNLDALTRQDLPAPYEVLIVDDEPDPAAERMVKAWATRRAGHHAILRYLPNTGTVHGFAAARNLAWRAANAPIIAFTDADTVPASDWLRQGLAAFELPATGAPPDSAPRASAPAHEQVDAVFGRVDARLPKHPTEHQVDTWLRDAGEFSCRNWFCRRAVLAKLGGFDERFGKLPGEAEDLHLRMLATGVRFSRAQTAVVAHPLLAESWGASLSYLRRLASESLLLQRHPRQYREQIHCGSTPRRPLPLWHDLAVVAALLLTALGLSLHHEVLTVAAGGTWLVLTGMLIIRRLQDTAKTAAHVTEVFLTSLIMPVLALCWRATGALRYRMQFARS